MTWSCSVAAARGPATMVDVPVAPRPAASISVCRNRNLRTPVQLQTTISLSRRRVSLFVSGAWVGTAGQPLLWRLVEAHLATEHDLLDLASRSLRPAATCGYRQTKGCL